MGRLGAEQVVGVATAERLVQILVDLRGSEWRVIGLERRGEWVRHARMAGAEDDEEIRVRPLEESAIGPRIGRPASMKVDVRRDEPAEPGRSRRRRGNPRAVRMDEESVDLVLQGVRISGIGAARM